jgi:hypothetical protein
MLCVVACDGGAMLEWRRLLMMQFSPKQDYVQLLEGPASLLSSLRTSSSLHSATCAGMLWRAHHLRSVQAAGCNDVHNAAPREQLCKPTVPIENTVAGRFT